MGLVWIAAFGAAGTLARYGLTRAMLLWLGPAFPWGTLAANAAGCLAFGWIAARVEARAAWDPALTQACLAGFLGAFTTFSTFAFETAGFLRAGAVFTAVIHLLANVGLGLGLYFLGAWLGRPASA